MSVDCKLFPAKLGFPPATDDVGQLVGDEVAVRLTANVIGFDQLESHPAVRALWCFRIDQARLEALARCEQLTSLYIEDARVPQLEPLGALEGLDVLGVDGATKVESLDWLDRIRPLSQLRLQGLPRVHSLKQLTAQGDLVALDVSGSMWTRMKVDSFGCLSALARLRFVYLTNIQCFDGALQVFADLPCLEELHIAGFYDWREFARLAGWRPDVRCTWFQPFLNFAQQRCDDCGGHLVMLTGKRQPTLCPRCKAGRLQHHVDRFLRVAREAAQQGDATDDASRRG